MLNFCSSVLINLLWLIEQTKVDLFASQPAVPSANPPPFDFFAAPDPVVQSETKSQKSDTAIPNIVDPFAAVPLNSFDGSDLFGSFTSHTNSASTEPTQNPANDGKPNNLNGKSSAEFQPPPKKDALKVKSGIWADSLSRGLIDLNISARKLLFLDPYNPLLQLQIYHIVLVLILI